MANLFCFGLGYSAAHYIVEYGARFWRIAGTVRTREKAASIASGALKHPVEAFVFDGSEAKPEITAAVMDANAILVSIPPRENGDPVLRHFADSIAAAPHLRSIVYLSTIGVYGDHKGEWVDETTKPAPLSVRSQERVAAEQEWIALGRRAEKAVVILRLVGDLRPRAERVHATEERTREAHRQAGAILQPHSRRRYRAGDRRGVQQKRERRAQRHRRQADRAGRAGRVCGRIARCRAAAANRVRRRREKHERDGAVVLWREQARAQRPVQARAQRHAALSDVSRRATARTVDEREG